MNEKEIITNFVNSEKFPIIHNFISEPYEKTIEELDKENQQLKEQNIAINKGLRKVIAKRKNGKENI